MGTVKNKVVIITGGSRGIGKATANLFAQEGATVVILARDKEALNNATKELQNESRTILRIQTDVRDSKQISDAVEKVIEQFGRIDILINNAAIINFEDFLEQEEKDWNVEIDTNIKGILICTRIVAPIMVKQKEGIIINIASGAGKTGYPGFAVYCATKFAVLGFTQGFAQEVANKGVRVYAVCPGVTQTLMTNFSGMPPEKVARRILETAKETLGLKPGEDTEIYS